MLTAKPTPTPIPPGTICLTFDDGPGPHTLEIARFLAQHEIRATFFVVGRHVERNLATVRQVRGLGHWIGNHTFHHRPLAALVWAGVDAAGEVIETDRLIADLIGDGPSLLRPPYGNWSASAAAALNQSKALEKYIGPIIWDIDCADHAIGGLRNSEAWTLEKCQTAYLNAIESRGAGVAALHDGGAAAQATLELVQWLVPRLMGRYEFKALDEVVRELPALA